MTIQNYRFLVRLRLIIITIIFTGLINEVSLAAKLNATEKKINKQMPSVFNTRHSTKTDEKTSNYVFDDIGSDEDIDITDNLTTLSKEKVVNTSLEWVTKKAGFDKALIIDQIRNFNDNVIGLLELNYLLSFQSQLFSNKSNKPIPLKGVKLYSSRTSSIGIHAKRSLNPWERKIAKKLVMSDDTPKSHSGTLLTFLVIVLLLLILLV